MDAFWDLSTCRTFGLALGPIPWRDIVFYADWAGLEDDVSRAFVRVIRVLDGAFLTWRKKKSDA